MDQIAFILSEEGGLSEDKLEEAVQPTDTMKVKLLKKKLKRKRAMVADIKVTLYEQEQAIESQVTQLEEYKKKKKHMSPSVTLTTVKVWARTPIESIVSQLSNDGNNDDSYDDDGTDTLLDYQLFAK